jgi:hypothetical protein
MVLSTPSCSSDVVRLGELRQMYPSMRISWLAMFWL